MVPLTLLLNEDFLIAMAVYLQEGILDGIVRESSLQWPWTGTDGIGSYVQQKCVAEIKDHEWPVIAVPVQNVSPPSEQAQPSAKGTADAPKQNTVSHRDGRAAKRKADEAGINGGRPRNGPAAPPAAEEMKDAAAEDPAGLEALPTPKVWTLLIHLTEVAWAQHVNCTAA